MKYNIQTKGLKEVQKKFASYGKEGAKKFGDITAIKAEDIKTEAKLNAQSQYIWDTGKLVQNIASEKVNELLYTIYAGMPYSAYMEFGTGRLREIPKGLEIIARQFIGKGIKEVNIPARPYLYPALRESYPKYIKDLQRGIYELNKKYS